MSIGVSVWLKAFISPGCDVGPNLTTEHLWEYDPVLVMLDKRKRIFLSILAKLESAYWFLLILPHLMLLAVQSESRRSNQVMKYDPQLWHRRRKQIFPEGNCSRWNRCQAGEAVLLNEQGFTLHLTSGLICGNILHWNMGCMWSCPK